MSCKMNNLIMAIPTIAIATLIISTAILTLNIVTNLAVIQSLTIIPPKTKNPSVLTILTMHSVSHTLILHSKGSPLIF